MKPIFTFLGLLLIIVSQPIHKIKAQSPGNPQAIQLTGPLGFIENKGQFYDENKNPRPDLLYLFHRDGIKVQLTKNRLSFELYTLKEDKNGFDESRGPSYLDKRDAEDRLSSGFQYVSSRLDVEFISANPSPEIVAEEMMPDYLNYYLAHTPPEGITYVKQYNKITYKNLYDNIDLVLIATPDQNPNNSLAYDFIVHPGGKIDDIKYRYHGSNGQMLSDKGILETSTREGKIVEMIPESYLQNALGGKLEPVNVSFKLKDNVISFNTEAYDQKQSLVIDPFLVWATYCGGDSSEEGRGLTTDSLGNVAIIGRGNSSENVATAGAYQTSLAGDVDVIVVKYDSAGGKIWGTYYGGTKADHGRGLIADHLNNFYLGCHTDSPDGCTTPGAYQENFAGGIGDDGLLAYFSSDGLRIWATYYGGPDDETIRRLTLNHAGDVLMVGYTFSTTGISTPGVYQPVYAGDADLCLSKWTPDETGGALIWGTYLGGVGEDHGRSVDVDKDDNIYVNGSTSSPGIAVGDVSRPTYTDKQDYLLGRFTTDGQIGWVSYWGGNVEDRGRGVYVDSSSTHVYFTGYSASATGVSTPGAYQENWVETYDNAGEPTHDMVLMKWTLGGQIVWSSYLGGQGDDRGRSITIIGDNEIYISGSTESFDTISTPDAFQPVWGGKGDMFLQIWDSNGNRVYGTYFGSTEDDDNLALAVDDAHNNIYLVGTSRSTDLGTPGTAQPFFGGFDDAFLVKIQVHGPALPPVAGFNYTNDPCITGQVQFTNNSIFSDSYSWNFGDGDTSNLASPLHTYSDVGDYTVTLIASSDSTGTSDTISMVITVMDTEAIAIITPAGPLTFCEGGSVVLNANTGVGYTYKWKNGSFVIPGATNSSYTATFSGNYKVEITFAPGCAVSSEKAEVTVLPNPIINFGADTTICDSAILTLDAGSGYTSYSWSTLETTQTINVSSANDYWVQVQDVNGCSGGDSIHVEVTTCSGIAGISNGGSINLYPNPTDGNFVLSLLNPKAERLRVQLENVLGQMVMDVYDLEGVSEFTGEINATSLPAGVYYVKVLLGSETITTKLVITK